MKCYECNEDIGFDMIETKTCIETNVNGIKIKIVGIPAYECPNCHDIFIDSDAADRVDEIIAEVKKKFSANTQQRISAKRNVVEEITYRLAA